MGSTENKINVINAFAFHHNCIFIVKNKEIKNETLAFYFLNVLSTPTANIWGISSTA